MQPINMKMIYYQDKKIKKRFNELKDYIITNKNIDLISLAQRIYFFTGLVQNDRYCTCFGNKSLSY